MYLFNLLVQLQEPYSAIFLLLKSKKKTLYLSNKKVFSCTLFFFFNHFKHLDTVSDAQLPIDI